MTDFTAEVAALTAATTSLHDAVSERKLQLDDAVTNVEDHVVSDVAHPQYARKDQNLADLNNMGTARTNLGLVPTASATDTTAGRLLTTGAGAAQAYRRGNLLGTVSQASGVPTGAVIERGNNGAGRYVKFADGTVIQSGIFTFDFSDPTQQAAALSTYLVGIDSVSWTFNTSQVDATTDGLCCLVFGRSEAGASENLIRSQVRYEDVGAATPAPGTTCDIFWTVIGRWY